MKTKLLRHLFFIPALISAMTVQAENTITLTTSKDVGQPILLTITATGSVTVSGATGTFANNTEVAYTLTSATVTITGNVTKLDCASGSIINNQLTSLDASGCTALTYLSCSNNNITSLDVSGCTALTELYCSYNYITSLDVSHNTALTYLECDKNKLDSLDVSRNTALTGLRCYYNSLTSLDVSHNTALTYLGCTYNKLTSLDVSRNTALTKLYCSNNKLPSLDVSVCTALTELSCSGNKLTSLDVSRNTALTSLECDNNKISGANMWKLVNSLPNRSGKTAGTFVVINTAGDGNVCTTSQVASAKAKNWKVDDSNGSAYAGSADPPGTITLVTSKAIGQTITLAMTATDNVTVSGATGTFANNKKVTYTLTSDTVTITGVVTALECQDNSLTSLDVSGCPTLTSLNCYRNSITSLDVSKNTALTDLNCYDNQLPSLDLSHNTALTYLDCYDNPLTSFDVSRNTALTELHCGNNKLTSLDVSHNTALTYLSCTNNSLTSLDVSHNTALTKLYCYNNSLTMLDVSRNTALTFLSCFNNKISGANMWQLVSSLVDRTGKDAGDFYVIKTAGDGNVCTTPQVALAKAKNWKVMDSSASAYAGSAAAKCITMISSKAVGSSISLKITATGSTTISGVNGTYNGEKLCIYTLTSDTVTITGDVTALQSSVNDLISLDVSGDTLLTSLDCEYNNLTFLYLGNNKALTSLDCSNNPLTSLDLSKNAALTELRCNSCHNLTSPDLSHNAALTDLYCDGNNFTSLDVSHNAALTLLSCNSCPFTTLNVSNNAALARLFCINCPLTKLDLSKNTALKILSCKSCPLDSLDLSKNTKLKTLECTSCSKLTKLDMSTNAELATLDCSHCGNLTSLDISKNAMLYELHCNNCPITRLRANGSPTLTTLYCYKDKIKNEEMDNLIASLPDKSGATAAGGVQSILVVVSIHQITHELMGGENNVCTKSQVAAATAKGWTVYAMTDSSTEMQPVIMVKYPGSKDYAITMVTSKKVGSTITLNMAATGNVTISGATGTFNSGMDVDYTLTSDTVTVKGYGIMILKCDGNDLTSLDASGCNALKTLRCYSNQLTTLNVSGCTALEFLSCYSNQLTTLDVSGCTALILLRCGNNRLTSLDVSGCTALMALSCDHNSLTSPDMSDCTALGYLVCHNNKIDVTNMGTLVNSLPDRTGKDAGKFFVINTAGDGNVITTSQVAIAAAKNWGVKDSVGTAYAGSQAQNSITLVTSKALNDYITLNIIASGNVTVSGATGTYVSGTNVNYQLTSDTVTITGDVTHLNCTGDSLISLDVTNDSLLAQLWCDTNHLTTLDVSHNPALLSLLCKSNPLGYIDVSNNHALQYFICGNDGLYKLDVSNNPALIQLVCNSNKLTTLDTSHNPALESLLCDNNDIIALDVSANPALQGLHCESNQIKSLNLANGTALVLLHCNNNLLDSLNVSDNIKLTEIDCHDNQLGSLDLTNNTSLEKLTCYSNLIDEANMGILVNSLVDRSNTTAGTLLAINLGGDGNVISTEQVAIAAAKNWGVTDSQGNDYAGSVPVGISGIEEDGVTVKEIYDTNGIRHSQLQRGINIIKLSNGKTVKKMVK